MIKQNQLTTSRAVVILPQDISHASTPSASRATVSRITHLKTKQQELELTLARINDEKKTLLSEQANLEKAFLKVRHSVKQIVARNTQQDGKKQFEFEGVSKQQLVRNIEGSLQSYKNQQLFYNHPKSYCSMLTSPRASPRNSTSKAANIYYRANHNKTATQAFTSQKTKNPRICNTGSNTPQGKPGRNGFKSINDIWNEPGGQVHSYL